jgi:hypothetical protein
VDERKSLKRCVLNIEMKKETEDVLRQIPARYLFFIVCEMVYVCVCVCVESVWHGK